MERFLFNRWIFIASVYWHHVIASMRYFHKDTLKNHDLIAHTNCLTTDYSLIQYPQYVHREVSHVYIKPETNFVFNIRNSPSLVLICPKNNSELLLYLQKVASTSMAKTISQEPVYIFYWPEPISPCLSVTQQYIPKLLFLDHNILESIVKSFPMDLDVYLSYNCEHAPGNNQFSTYLIELYSVHKTLPIIQPILKDFSKCEISTEDIVNKVERRSNFHSVPLRGVYYVQYYHQDEQINHEIDRIKMQQSFHKLISMTLNITLIEIVGKGWIGHSCFEWGKESDDLIDCPLTGMGQQLLSDEVDIILESSELVPYRARYLRPLQPTDSTRITAIFRQPQWSLLRNIYIKSFSPSLWLVLLLVSVTVIVSTIAVCQVSVQMLRNHAWDYDIINIEENQLIVQSTMWFISSMSMQGWHVSASSLTLKIIHISALTLAMVCYAAFSSTIFSILSNQKGPIMNYDSLVRSDLPVIADGWILNAIRAAEDVNIKRGLRTPIKTTDRSKMQDAYSAIKSSNTALLTRYIWMQYAFDWNVTRMNDACRTFTTFTNNFGLPILGVMYIQRNSSLKEYLNYPIVVLTETGLRQRFISIYHSEKHLNCLPPEKTPQPFGASDVFSLYMVLLTGFIASIVLLIKENVECHLSQFYC